MKLPRFDTRDTKPKLRALLILTLTALLAVVVLLLAWGERCAAAVCFVLLWKPRVLPPVDVNSAQLSSEAW